jgi:hypothetical protein
MATIDWGTEAEFEANLKGELELAKATEQDHRIEVLTKALDNLAFSQLNKMKSELTDLVGLLNTSYSLKTSGSIESALIATHKLIDTRRKQLMAVEMLVERIEKKAEEIGMSLSDLDR